MQNEAIVYGITILSMIAISVIDIKIQRIPHICLVPIALACLISQTGVFSAAWGQCLIAALLFGGLFLAFAVFGRCGGGDVIIVAVIALCFGLKGTFITVFVASGAMVIWFVLRNIIAVLKRNEIVEEKSMSYPYAPFLTIGFIVHTLINFARK
jgi:prepilin signal peptidase PulO-like enzyme (type II secretory pathway)